VGHIDQSENFSGQKKRETGAHVIHPSISQHYLPKINVDRGFSCKNKESLTHPHKKRSHSDRRKDRVERLETRVMRQDAVAKAQHRPHKSQAKASLR